MDRVPGPTPGPMVVDAAAADDEIASSVHKLLVAQWATKTADRTTLDPGPPGVRQHRLPGAARGTAHARERAQSIPIPSPAALAPPGSSPARPPGPAPLSRRHSAVTTRPSPAWSPTNGSVQ
ncbi:DUF6207 family protein [Streptomyces sp. ALI-76-A]|uniref:DUF6207 family protein n=1 Tax=Streptomyces sp. ALI-76-A TaxID=3025736 RepID=UPI00256EE937|nr:DUF6207 family protein [Streptomyces sp. ALI-76-A]MDL5198944.1 DUF6207 family protein [Streptomyces sp. ALI-76-A]